MVSSFYFSGEDMALTNLLAVERLQQEDIIHIVEDRLRWFNIKPQSKVDVWFNDLTSWEAAVGANDRVYIFTLKNGQLSLDITPCCGFGMNGKLILDYQHKENICPRYWEFINKDYDDGNQ